MQLNYVRCRSRNICKGMLLTLKGSFWSFCSMTYFKKVYFIGPSHLSVSVIIIEVFLRCIFPFFGRYDHQNSVNISLHLPSRSPFTGCLNLPLNLLIHQQTSPRQRFTKSTIISYILYDMPYPGLNFYGWTHMIGE